MTLRTRLTAVLLALFLGIGATLLLGLRWGAGQFLEEIDWRLNRDVAAHLAKSLQPFGGEGALHRDQALGLDQARIDADHADPVEHCAHPSLLPHFAGDAF